ncbi:MAG: BCCT family transporter [Halomonas sp.]|uniref:BCCT family transporter n=1 Tax=Halomonas sp. TaxID=1486246 RepID=UPI00286FFD3D|nr:BCCT family transporter [Halomonas sp.]MDR9440606.1 BCCT family transporter [Halomonas sp.]
MTDEQNQKHKLAKSVGPFKRMQPTVFFGSAALVIGFCLFGGVFTATAAATFASIQGWIADTLGWYYMLISTALLVFALGVVISPAGKLKLGKPEDEPEFRRLNWFAMLFAAGMGTGLVFWGVAEPLNHYLEPHYADPATTAAMHDAMRYSFFHWGLHAWAIYLVLALSIAYYHFRIDLPLAPRSVLWPLIGKRIYGMPGHLTDILCTVGTLLGVATSLGLGAMQINAGLSMSLGIETSTLVQVLIIAAITAAATLSVVSGIQHGIRRLSALNIALASVLLLFVFVVGPTAYILETLTGGLGIYLQTLVTTSLETDFATTSDWQSRWTLFYWGWWISWSPFVGIFVARISRGRSVRELITAGLLLPSLVTFFWMATFGGTALHMERFTEIEIAQQAIDDVAISLHLLLSELPLGSITTVFATLVIIIFFITSSDSGSLVDDMVTSGGYPNPPVSQRLFWAISEGAVAATLLVVGGLAAIQQAAIAMALPMTLLLAAACYGMMRAFSADIRKSGTPSQHHIAGNIDND